MLSRNLPTAGNTGQCRFTCIWERSSVQVHLHLGMQLRMHFSKRERAHALRVKNPFEFPLAAHFPAHMELEQLLPSRKLLGRAAAPAHPDTERGQGLCLQLPLDCPSGAEFLQDTAQDTLGKGGTAPGQSWNVQPGSKCSPWCQE